jgi:hypothetical protein
MMNKTLLACTFALILGGCGGGSDSGGDTTAPAPEPTPAPTPAPTPEPVPVDTVDLEVDPDFTFRTDMDLTLELTEVPTGTGVINVYHDYDFHDVENEIYYPNYQTRVLTFHPSATTSVVFQVSKNWEHLVVEYVPTDAQGIEMYKKLDLTTDTTLSFKFGD